MSPIKRSNVTPDYGWNERAGRYVNLSTGRFVTNSQIKGALEGMVDASKRNINGLSQSLLDGDISLAEWRASMMAEIKTMHTAAAAAKRGGWAQMSQSDWGWTGSKIKAQYQYLERFAQQILDGTQKLDGRVLTRANLYGMAQRGTFEEMGRRLAFNAGYTEERRVLGAAEHCDGCVEQAGQGWQPLGTLDPIGGEECRTNCQCEFEYR